VDSPEHGYEWRHDAVVAAALARPQSSAVRGARDGGASPTYDLVIASSVITLSC
jgi:hypothetical protein